MNRLFTLLFFLSSTFAMNAKEWTLQNDTLKLVFDDNKATFSVTDLRSGKVWQQSVPDSISVINTKEKNGKLQVRLKEKFSFDMGLSLNGNGLDVYISSRKGQSMERLEYPTAFITESDDDYLLLTDGEGMLLPVKDQNYPFGEGATYFCGGGLSMPWMGMTDNKVDAGYMVILDTPYDAGIKPFRQENGLVSFQPYWLSSFGELNYERHLIYRFFDKGGYVAQCKAYRSYVKSKRKISTLKEKEQTMLMITKMVGAPQIYVWDTGREVSMLKELKKSGIDKAFIFWNANHGPYPVAGYSDSIRAMGYAAGGYELFTDLHKRDTIIQKGNYKNELHLRHSNYPGQYNQLAARNQKGDIYFNQFGITACPLAMKENIAKKMERIMDEYPVDGEFLDVYVANGLFECHNPEHLLTRKGYAEQIIDNYCYLNSKYNHVLGGEWGGDFANAYLSFAQGMMTLQRPWWHFADNNKVGTIYYGGNWRNNSAPSIMVGSYTASDNYLKYSINEANRVPLYELVYHDVIMTTWRWEDCNHHAPEIWWKKDLFNMLYGSYPIWCIDRNRWEAFKNTFVESYNNLSPWLQKIGYDEMVNHCFITSDGKIQKSDFSSGLSIVVNFSEANYLYNGHTVRSHSYIIL